MLRSPEFCAFPRNGIELGRLIVYGLGRIFGKRNLGCEWLIPMKSECGCGDSNTKTEAQLSGC